MAKRSRKRKTDTVPAKVAVAKPSRDWLWGLILLGAVFMAYSPVWWAGYVWDDDRHLTANPCIIGPLGLKEIWTTSAARICPFVLTTFWAEHALWGLAPLPYHLVNVLMHAAGAVVLWQVLRSLQVPGAWLGAALWALHPVQVESVAWITEMKNTESGLFFLLSILFFLRWVKEHNGWSYPLTVLFAAMAMASKSSTVILPVVLCLCAWWVEGRWQWRNLARVVPIFLMALIAVVVSIWTQKLEGGLDSTLARTWPERLVTAGDAVWFYLGKLFWPYPLITVYPRWQIDASQWSSYLPLLAVIIALFILWLGRWSWARLCFFAFAYFLAALLPVLGLVDHYFLHFSFVADHFQYLASMGPLALAGAGMVWLANFIIPGRRGLQSILGAGVLLILASLSWQRAWSYESDEMLWTDTLTLDPNSWVSYDNLGNALVQKGQVDKAIEQYRKALEINPKYAPSHSNLGSALSLTGQGDAALVQYQQALEIDPDNDVVHFNLGNALFQRGQVDEAIAQFQKALEISPNYSAARNNLGNALLKQGRMDEATAQFQKTLEIDPHNVDAANNLGLAYLRTGRLDQSIEQFQKALEISPNNDVIHCNLGNALFRTGRMEEAIVQYQKTLEINPNNVAAQSNLAKAWQNAGRK